MNRRNERQGSHTALDARQNAAVSKKLYIKTYGCQMNVYDSARMADVLAPIGFAPGETPEDADMVILNTCHIREKAAEKVYSELGRLAKLKARRARQGKPMVIAVAGCVAQAEGEEVQARAPCVDIVLGPQAYHRLPEMVARVARAGGTVVDTEFPVESKFDHLPEESAVTSEGRGVSAFLTIQEGCDRFCTFCVVPYTRGAEFSRSVADVLTEAQRLIAAGAREIVLLGQNVNAYHGLDTSGREVGLDILVRRLAELENLARIRYTTSHPKDMTEGLIAAHGEVDKLMPFLHLPVQSGSDALLRAMNRHHTADMYRRIVDGLRTARPDMALSSDFIVGYPGETEADFKATLALIETVGYAQAFSFKFSARPGTPAADLPDQMPEDLKSARLTELQALLEHQQRAFNAAQIGQRAPVLFERTGREAGQVSGRNPFMQWVHVSAPLHRIGRVADVTITDAHANSLSGILVGASNDHLQGDPATRGSAEPATSEGPVA